MLKILYVDPGPLTKWLEHYKKIIDTIRRPDVDARIVGMSSGPTDLEYHLYEHAHIGEILQKIREADKEGFDAAFISCFYDPGLREAKEIAKMPVTGPAEACMHVAATLGHKFSIVTGRRKFISKMEDNVNIYGLERKLASIRTVDFSVKEMGESRERLKEALLREAKKAVEEDGAEIIILGCTCESGFSKDYIDKFKVPVIDPVVVGWKFTELLADLYHNFGISQSKIGDYEAPPDIDTLI